MKLKRDELKEVLTDSDLERYVTINLSETETMWMLDITGICVAETSEEAPAIVAQNERYQEVGVDVDCVALTSHCCSDWFVNLFTVDCFPQHSYCLVFILPRFEF